MIIMFHYVRMPSSFKITVNNFYNFENFKKNIKDLLTANINFLNPSELSKEDWIFVSKDSSSVVLSFDDGYLDHSRLVAPFLDTLGIKGIFFIPSKMLIERKILIVNKIHIILNIFQDKEKFLYKKILDFFEFKNTFSKSDIERIKHLYLRNGKYDNMYVNFFKKVCQHILNEKDLDEFSCIFLNLPDLNSNCSANDLYLNIEEFRSMSMNGHTLGLHGHEHLYLSKLNKSDQLFDIKQSIEIFKEQKITKNFLLGYPYGDYNDNTLKVCEDLKIKIGFIDNMYNTSADHPHLTIPRIDCNDYFNKAKVI